MKRSFNFSMEERLRIVREYCETDASVADITRKYGLTCTSLLSVWVQRYKKVLYGRNVISLRHKSHTPMPKTIPDPPINADSNREELLAQISRLEKSLEWEKMRNRALETLIDIAEEHGMKIRKKSGAKQ